jgi:hypothetical protein
MEEMSHQMRKQSEKNAKNCQKFAKIDKNARLLNKNSTKSRPFEH